MSEAASLGVISNPLWHSPEVIGTIHVTPGNAPVYELNEGRFVPNFAGVPPKELKRIEKIASTAVGRIFIPPLEHSPYKNKLTEKDQHKVEWPWGTSFAVGPHSLFASQHYNIASDRKKEKKIRVERSQ